jgi:hypothetical protein
VQRTVPASNLSWEPEKSARNVSKHQTVINNVLRDYVEGKTAAPDLEATLRRVIREELRPIELA